MNESLFDFIDDEELKIQCTQDTDEYWKCYNSEAYKACIVLVGSLIETVLFYYFDKNQEIKKTINGFDKRELKLRDMLHFAKQHQIISEELFKLADQIRDFRNYIHPKVSLRTKNKISRNIVQIGYSVLLEIILMIKTRLAKDMQRNTEDSLKNLLQHHLGRLPTNAEIFLYVPILKKYGNKGEIVILKNIEKGKRT